MQGRLWQVYGIGLLLLVLLFVAALPFYVRQIPEYLATKARGALQVQHIEWASVQGEGRDIIISGKAPNTESYRQALQTVQGVGWVRNVVDHMTPRIVSPYTMSLEWRDGKLNLEGFVPDEEGFQSIQSLLKASYGDDVSLGKLQLANGHPEAWQELVEVLLANVHQFDQAQVDLVGQALSLSGKTELSSVREQVMQSLSAFSQQGYAFDMHIVAADAAGQLCQQKFNELLQTRIVFASGDSRISESSLPLLQQLADTATLCPTSLITIAGHTDNQGGADANLKLSEQRAKAVAGRLFSLGVGNERLRTVGYGDTRAIADNATEVGRAKNRRIEFLVQER